MRHFYHVEMERDNRDRFRANVSNLFQMVSSEVNRFWMALRNLLQKEVLALSEDSDGRITAIDLIIFTLEELQPALSSQTLDS